MTSLFDFSLLISAAERKVLASPEKWRWISPFVPVQMASMRHPVHERWTAKHSHSPPMRHIILTLAGNVPVTVRNKVYPMKLGTVIMFDSGEKRGLMPGPYHRGFRHMHLFQVNTHCISSNINAIDFDGTHRSSSIKFITGKNVELLKEAWDECRRNPDSPLHWGFLKSIVIFLFFRVAAKWPEKEPMSSHEQVVDSISDYIQNHLHENLTLKRLSEIAGYSPFFFHRLFIRFRKQTLHYYIVEARIHRAKMLLEQGYTVEAVSREIGMTSAASFSRFFKLHTTNNPSMWRVVHETLKN